jgi:uncharacterized protein (DUF427 family)
MAQPLDYTDPPLEERLVESEATRDEPYRIRFEPSGRRVRAMIAGEAVADSTRVMLMLETRRLPVYYFPLEDIRRDLLAPSDHRTDSPHKGQATYWHVRVGKRPVVDAAWAYRNPPRELAPLADYVAFYWHRMDAWFEEDDEVFVHPRDPYHRVDVLQSSRHVVVVVGGETVAETHRPRLLFETSLPTRYYIPKLDVRLDLLTPSETTTACPYKGTASYWSVKMGRRVFKDYVWGYPSPIPECPKIENHLAFFNEKVDALYVDGELQPVPLTPWSTRRRGGVRGDGRG